MGNAKKFSTTYSFIIIIIKYIYKAQDRAVPQMR